MIRIYKDKDMKVVTKGAYEQFYKSQGYNIVLDVEKEKVVEKIVEEPTKLDETVTRPKRGSSYKRNKKED